MENQFTTIQRHRKWIAIFFIAIYAVILSSFIIKGYSSRYLQDDYCYGGDVRQKGFFTAQIYAYFEPTEYNGNRFSLTFFSGIAELAGGARAERYLPGLSLLIWLFTLIYLIHQIQIKLFNSAYLTVSILVALILLTYTLYLAPDLYQVLYWRSGRLPYLTPLILNSYLLARELKLSRENKIKLIYYAEFLLLGFISSGFSETTAAVQFALWLLVLIANIVSESKRQNLGLALLISSVLGATVVGILLLAISPSNISRLTAVSVKRPDFAIFIKQSFIFGLDFIRYSLHDKWLPFAVLFALSYGMSLLFPIQKSMHKKKVVMNVIIVILATYLISVVNSMPTMMIRSVFPRIVRGFQPITYSYVQPLQLVTWLLLTLHH